MVVYVPLTADEMKQMAANLVIYHRDYIGLTNWAGIEEREVPNMGAIAEAIMRLPELPVRKGVSLGA